jgi:hypothetical protein
VGPRRRPEPLASPRRSLAGRFRTRVSLALAVSAVLPWHASIYLGSPDVAVGTERARLGEGSIRPHPLQQALASLPRSGAKRSAATFFVQV